MIVYLVMTIHFMLQNPVMPKQAFRYAPKNLLTYIRIIKGDKNERTWFMDNNWKKRIQPKES